MIIIENLVIKNEAEKKEFLESLQKGNIVQIQHLGCQHVNTDFREDSIDLESSKPEISGHPEKFIEKDILIKEIKDSVTEKNVDVLVEKKLGKMKIIHYIWLFWWK